MESAKQKIRRIQREIEKTKMEIGKFEEDFDKKYKNLSDRIDRELEALKRECNIKF